MSAFWKLIVSHLLAPPGAAYATGTLVTNQPCEPESADRKELLHGLATFAAPCPEPLGLSCWDNPSG